MVKKNGKKTTLHLLHIFADVGYSLLVPLYRLHSMVHFMVVFLGAFVLVRIVPLLLWIFSLCSYFTVSLTAVSQLHTLCSQFLEN